MKPSWITIGLLLLLSGCAAPTMYYWGQYENDVYLMYRAPDKATAERQIESMESDIEKARSEDKPLPPGFRAHLGFLYAQVGNLDRARALFTEEKKVFPESTRLMDHFINNLSPQ